MAVKKLKTKLDRLEIIAESLESDAMEIEGSLKLFEEGMKLVRDCNKDLDALEGRVQILVNGNEEELEKRIK